MQTAMWVCLVALAVSPRAWAVGERVAMPGGDAPYVEQLEQTLCRLVECAAEGSGPPDASIRASLVGSRKGGSVLTLTVRGRDGAVKTTLKVPANAVGRLATADLVAATSALIAAIEAAPGAGRPTPRKCHASRRVTCGPVPRGQSAPR